MTGMLRLQLFQFLVLCFGTVVVLAQCISLTKELKQYKGYSIRSGKHNLYRVYQIMLKPLGLTLAFIAVYSGLKFLYLQTFDTAQVVIYDIWPSLNFGIAALCICFQLYALLERAVLKHKLKEEYIDYCFWDINIKSKNERPLRYQESKREEFPLVRAIHYIRIVTSIILGVMFIASGIESMNFFRAICPDQIYEARDDQPDVTLYYKDVLTIERDPDDSDFYIVRGNAGQELCFSNDASFQYLVQQSGISIQD